MSYDATEKSQHAGSPVELYEFVYDNSYMRYTSAAEPQVFQGQTYAPYAMQRDAIKTQTSSVEQALVITAYQDFPPAQLFRTQAPSAVVNVTVRRRHMLDTGSEFSVIWVGRVLSVAWAAPSECKMNCESDFASMKRIALRRPYQFPCPWVLYGVGCGLLADHFATTLNTFSAQNRTVSAPDLAALPVNWFAGGYIKYLNPLNGVTEAIAVRSSAAGVLNLALFPIGLSAAALLTVYPGCAHTLDDCTNKFHNTDNFGGTPFIPLVNPFAGASLF